MNTNRMMAALTLALTATVSVGVASQIAPKVIYGEDNRADVYQVADSQLRELADSTVALIHRNNISGSQGIYKVASKSLGQEMALCQGEAFANQPSAANCSGSLIAEDLVMTAGHCVSLSTCNEFKFVFGYAMQNASVANTTIPESEVYSCKEVYRRVLDANADYAVVRLDRPVRGHKPLTLAANNVNVDDDVFVIGHPSGLPTKIAGGAKVRSTTPFYFVSNLDTYGGNSGSAVFSAKSHEVVGILVRGAQDFVYDRANKCTRSNICADSGCRGEDVTHISLVNEALSK